MKKGIRLNVKLWVEGDAEPAQPFLDLTSRMVKEIVSAGQPKFPGFSFVVRDINEDTSSEEDASPQEE